MSFCFHLAIVDPVRGRKRCFIVTDLLNRQVRHFLLSVTSHLPQMCVNVCLRVCSILPHLPPTDDFGDGCHGDTSNAADELIGCVCLSLPMGDCCAMIHHRHRAAQPGAFVSTELLTVQAVHCEMQQQQGRHSLTGQMMASMKRHDRRHSASDVLLKVLQHRRSSALEILSSSSHRLMVAVSVNQPQPFTERKTRRSNHTEKTTSVLAADFHFDCKGFSDFDECFPNVSFCVFSFSQPTWGSPQQSTPRWGRPWDMSSLVTCSAPWPVEGKLANMKIPLAGVMKSKLSKDSTRLGTYQSQHYFSYRIYMCVFLLSVLCLGSTGQWTPHQ